MPTINLENVPDEGYGILKKQAESNKRPLSEEALARLLSTLSVFDYGKAVDEAPIGFFRSTPGATGHFTFANKKFAEILGYESGARLVEEVKDIAKDVLVDPEKRKEFDKALREPGSVVTGFEYRLKTKHKHKTVITASLTAKRVETSDGIFFEGFLQDITEQKDAEDVLKKIKAELESVLRNIHGFVYTCRTKYPWENITVSVGCLELTGYSQEELKNNKPRWVDLILPKFKEIVKKKVAAAVKAGQVYTIVYRIRTARGRKWVYERGRAYYDAEGKPTHLEGLVIDYDDRKKMRKLSFKIA